MIKKLLIQVLSAAVGTGVLGLIVGYLIYGKIAGDYVSLSTIFSPSGNILESAAQSISGIDAIRTKILISGGVGALIGLAVRIWPAIKLMK